MPKRNGPHSTCPYEGHVELITRAMAMSLADRREIVTELEQKQNSARGITEAEYFWLRAVKISLTEIKPQRRV